MGPKYAISPTWGLQIQQLHCLYISLPYPILEYDIAGFTGNIRTSEWNQLKACQNEALNTNALHLSGTPNTPNVSPIKHCISHLLSLCVPQRHPIKRTLSLSTPLLQP